MAGLHKTQKYLSLIYNMKIPTSVGFVAVSVKEETYLEVLGTTFWKQTKINH